MEPSGSSGNSSIGSKPGGPGSEMDEAKPLVEAKKARGPKILTAVLVAIIVILAAALAYVEFYHPAKPVSTGPLSIQTATTTGVQGQSVTFDLLNLAVGAKAVVHLGDGTDKATTSSSFGYTYTSPGTYFVYMDEFAADGSKLADTASALLKLYVSPDPALVAALSKDVTVPTIAFNTTRNPNAPIGTTTAPMFFYGGFGEISALGSTPPTSVVNPVTRLNVTTSSAVSVSGYAWDFANSKTITVAADPSTSLPSTNPVNTSFTTSGLYPVKLTLTTSTVTTIEVINMGAGNQTTWTNTTTATHSFAVIYTVAIGSNFAVAKFRGIVPQPGVITELVNSPGGPYSFDPEVDYETTGFEVVVNTQATLLIYNGSSTTNWIPYVADTIPTTANGQVSSDFKTYTFHIRSGMHFSNGDPITAYDVWYTMIRSMLFQGGSPGTADWIISQYLVPAPYFSAFVPIMTSASSQAEFAAINNSVSYDSNANTVTFHLVATTAPTLFFTAICDALGTGIMDAAWLQSVGAGITFTPAGFFAYQAQGTEGGYNFYTQFQPVSSGPFQINTYVPGQSVVLTPNPGFPGVPGIAAQNKTIIIEWVADPAVAYQLFASGQGDIVTLLPPNYYQTINTTLVPAQQAVIKGPFPSITEFFNVYNNNISVANLGKIGSGYSIPHDYFANLWVREAFAYAFDYATFLNRVLGNQIYGFDFGSSYCGVIVKGLPYYVPPANLTGCPTYDLIKAKQLLQQSGAYNTPVTFPFVVPSGDTTDYGMGGIWAAALASIDPNINMQPVYQNFATIIGYQSNGTDPMPIFSLGWIADYPYPSDYVNAMYEQGGTYPQSLGWYAAYFNQEAAATTNATLAAMYRGEAANWSAMNAALLAGDAATDPAVAAAKYAACEQLAIKLYMYVYTFQSTAFWIVKPYMTPYNNDWGYQTNPTIGAGADSFFAWWNKG
jgi:peptide/nickel transport system substrate-binding protein